MQQSPLRTARAGLLCAGALIALASLSACLGPDEGGTGWNGEAIIDGDLETGYSGIGALLIRQGDVTAICTGTTIAPGWVLTAVGIKILSLQQQQNCSM